jgi:hypothetical protein
MLRYEHENDRTIGTRRTRKSVLLAVATVVVLLIAIAVWVSPGGRGDSNTEFGAARTVTGEPRHAGTSGQHSSAVSGQSSIDGDNSGPALTTVAGLESMLGVADGQELVGRRVQLRVPVQRHVNDVAFWVGSGDKALLVVLARDTRDGLQRQRGEPGGVATGVDADGELISGTIERLPHAEAMFSWGLTNADVARLKERPVYLRAIAAGAAPAAS